jgi:hypothetical protein
VLLEAIQDFVAKHKVPALFRKRVSKRPQIGSLVVMSHKNKSAISSYPAKRALCRVPWARLVRNLSVPETAAGGRIGGSMREIDWEGV